jgi:hypothetical protein
MKTKIVLAVLAASLPLPALAQDALTAFGFETLASRNAAFDRSSYVYPETHDLKGQINPNAGDVRLDGVVIDGKRYGPESLLLVTSAKIVHDDAVDERRGGGNLTAGFGIGADTDSLVGEGTGSTTPTPEILAAAHGNLNLSSIVAVRENVGTAIYEVNFDTATDTLLLWERGNSGDVQVDAVDDNGNVVASLLVLDGKHDGDAASTYSPTGVTVTTYVQDGFLNQGQQLSSVGLKSPVAVKTFRFTALQEPEGPDAVRYDGPDLKAVGLAR